jgi:hypothetical protein
MKADNILSSGEHALNCNGRSWKTYLNVNEMECSFERTRNAQDIPNQQIETRKLFTPAVPPLQWVDLPVLWDRGEMKILGQFVHSAAVSMLSVAAHEVELLW